MLIILYDLHNISVTYKNFCKKQVFTKIKAGIVKLLSLRSMQNKFILNLQG